MEDAACCRHDGRWWRKQCGALWERGRGRERHEIKKINIIENGHIGHIHYYFLALLLTQSIK